MPWALLLITIRCDLKYSKDMNRSWNVKTKY